MKYTITFLKMLISCCLLFGVTGVVMASSTDVVPPGAVNPVNAIIATVVAAVAGVFIYILRHKEN